MEHDDIQDPNDHNTQHEPDRCEVPVAARPPRPRKHIPLLTISEMKAFRRCHRYHHLRYRMGYRPINDVGPLSFGKLIHTGLEVWWNTHSLEATIEAIKPQADQEYDPFTLAKAECLLTGYHFRWEKQDLETLATEVEFRTDLVNPATGRNSRTFQLGGKIDAIAKDDRDQHWVVEHKTTSEDITQGSEYWLRLRLDAQVSTYYTGAKALGYDVQGCLYDVIRKPLLRQSAVPLTDDDGLKIVLDRDGQRVMNKDGKKWRQTGDIDMGYVLQTRPETVDEYRARLIKDIADNPDKYFARGEVMRLEEDMKDAAADTWQISQQIREAEKLQRYPRNPGACTEWNRTCEYFGVCTRSASLDDPYQFRKMERTHEELSGEPKTEKDVA